jgi:hypothetical protein
MSILSPATGYTIIVLPTETSGLRQEHASGETEARAKAFRFLDRGLHVIVTDPSGDVLEDVYDRSRPEVGVFCAA